MDLFVHSWYSPPLKLLVFIRLVLFGFNSSFSRISLISTIPASYYFVDYMPPLGIIGVLIRHIIFDKVQLLRFFSVQQHFVLIILMNLFEVVVCTTV